MSTQALGLTTPSAESAEISDNAAELLAAKPQLRKHINVTSQNHRGEIWWVLENKETGVSFRLDQHAHNTVDQFNGERTIGDILASTSSNQAHGQQSVIALISQLEHAGLIRYVGDTTPTQAVESRANIATSSILAKLKNPLGIRIPVCDPDAFLEKLLARSEFAQRGYVSAAIMLIMLAGLIVAYQQFGALSTYGAVRANELASLALLAMVYPFIKGIHEFAHAYMIKRHGGEVHEVGVMLLVFFPVPYVDATASGAFKEKRQRIEVSSAGIIAELVLASLALLVWANVQHGLLSDIAFSIALVGGVSTLLFNGNPLLRFDGYFVLSDYLEIPNLATRARAFCLHLARRFLLGVDELVTPVTARGEPAWFIGYFIASSMYRLLIMLTIALYLFHLVPLLGAMLALFVIFNQIIKPGYNTSRYLATDPELGDHRPQSVAIASAISLTMAMSICLLPVPNWTALPGVVRMPETSTVRAPSAGFVSQLLASEGMQVSAGEPVVVIDNPTLDKEKARLKWHLNELEARRAEVALASPNQAAQYADTIVATKMQLADVSNRLHRLLITAPRSGYLQYLVNTDWLGRYLEEGTVFAHVINAEQRRIITVVPESAIAEIRNADVKVGLRSIDNPQVTLPARIVAITPAASRDLPNAALGSNHGGTITVDSRDRSGKQALEQVFQIEIEPINSQQLRPGSKVIVRFDLENKSLGDQLLAFTRRLLMKEVQW